VFWELFYLRGSTPEPAGRRHVPHFTFPDWGCLVAILLVLLMGIFATNVVGRRMLGWLDGPALPDPHFPGTSIPP